MDVVLFRPLVENLRNDRARAWFGAPQLTDRGDHVEYFNGRQTFSWRLPDQSGSEPELARILVAGVRIPASLKVGTYTVVFYGADDALLSRMTFRGHLSYVHYNQTLPETAFDQLVDRGVRLDRVTYADGPRMYREHPELAGNSALERNFRKHPAIWISAAMVLIVVVVNLVLLARGYYS